MTDDDRADDAATWDAFVRGPKTLPETEGVRAAWHRGRARYFVWVLRVRTPSVRARVRAVAKALGSACAAIAPRNLHVTLFVAGFGVPTSTFDDDVTFAILEAQAQALRRAAGPVRLAVGGAHSFLSVPFLTVADLAGDLGRLRETLRQHAREVRFAPYRPHVTVGRYVQSVSTEGLAARLAPLREEPWLAMRLTTVDLVSFDAREPDSPLITARRIELSSSAGSPLTSARASSPITT